MNCINRYEPCDREAYSKGMCLMHYKRDWRRMKNYGTLDVPEMRGGYRAQNAVSKGKHRYDTTHKKIAKVRGKATNYSCIDCDNPAEQWSYNHDSLFEITDVFGGYEIPYSPRVIDYDPRCCVCHRRFDLGVKQVA